MNSSLLDSAAKIGMNTFLNLKSNPPSTTTHKGGKYSKRRHEQMKFMLHLCAQGFTNAEIARVYDTTERKVESALDFFSNRKRRKI